jgi:hypothetical protein
MVPQTNTSGTFQEVRWFMSRICLTIHFGFLILTALEEAEVLNLPERDKEPTFPRNLRSISLLTTTSK